MTAVKFTKAEVESILAQLDAGTALTHEIAERYECEPSAIWALWNERHRER